MRRCEEHPRQAHLGHTPRLQRTPCEYSITAKATATAGDATFTIPYASSSGATLDAQVTVKVSNIAYTAPTNLTMAAGETLAVSAGSYASDGTFTITCADTTSISPEFTSVSRTANTCNYSAIAKATASAGAATSQCPTPLQAETPTTAKSPSPSQQFPTQPPQPQSSSRLKHRHQRQQLGFAHRLHRLLRRCEKHPRKTHLGHQNSEHLQLPHHSQNNSHSRRRHLHHPLHLFIGSDTGRTSNRKSLQHRLYTAPTNLTMAAGETLAISAASYASDGTFTISCANATSISTQFTSVTRTANTCNYSAIAKATATAGAANFTVPYTSSGGDTHNGTISITITTISYTAPTGLKVVAGSNTDITASSWASHTGYTITCGDAKSIHAKLSSVARPDAATKPCEYRITAKATATAGDATFTIPYASSSGATLDAHRHSKGFQHRIHSTHQSHNGSRRNTGGIGRQLRF